MPKIRNILFTLLAKNQQKTDSGINNYALSRCGSARLHDKKKLPSLNICLLKKKNKVLSQLYKYYMRR